MHFSMYQGYSVLLTRFSLLLIIVLTITGCEIAPKGVKFRTYDAHPTVVCEGTGCKELASEKHE
ncbi:hypothetical protein [Alteromonas sp. C1M14]|uniref:hypothetical protein n=1 Tax=Alteromonas sp. C1M14 TaxID=2841567 RepID=UPI001C0A61F6|nr:hypothetical protein [Alteromonas sp. C1M14]MBU2979993.1 hypothetical protein [Alteromonas sp. C1M14]